MYYKVGLNNPIIGQFVAGDSLTHRLDPRTKLLCCLAIIATTFLVNDVTHYKYPKQPVKYDKLNQDYIPHYLQTDSTLVTTALGAQIFKNLGKNFWWDAGAKLYIQGYRAGDSELTGSLNSSFRIAKDTAGFFANGGIFLTTPELFEDKYFSNHLKWDNGFRQKKIVRFTGGIRIPTKHLELSAGGQFLNDHIYWQFNGLPDQSSDVLQVYHATLKKRFKFGGFRSHNNLVFQHSSDQDIIPLPMLAYYNSTYYQNTLFKVLFFQIGFDLRYNSKYYEILDVKDTTEQFLQGKHTWRFIARDYRDLHFSLSATTSSDEISAYIDQDDMFDISSDLALDMMAKLSAELRVSEEQMISLLHHSVKQRTARLLLTLIDSADEADTSRPQRLVRLQRTEMAQILGTTPESLSRTLHTFAEEKLIDSTRTSITLLDRTAMERLASKS